METTKPLPNKERFVVLCHEILKLKSFVVKIVFSFSLAGRNSYVHRALITVLQTNSRAEFNPTVLLAFSILLLKTATSWLSFAIIPCC